MKVLGTTSSGFIVEMDGEESWPKSVVFNGKGPTAIGIPELILK